MRIGLLLFVLFASSFFLNYDKLMRICKYDCVDVIYHTYHSQMKIRIRLYKIQEFLQASPQNFWVLFFFLGKWCFKCSCGIGYPLALTHHLYCCIFSFSCNEFIVLDIVVARRRMSAVITKEENCKIRCVNLLQ